MLGISKKEETESRMLQMMFPRIISRSSFVLLIGVLLLVTYLGMGQKLWYQILQGCINLLFCCEQGTI